MPALSFLRTIQFGLFKKKVIARPVTANALKTRKMETLSVPLRSILPATATRPGTTGLAFQLLCGTLSVNGLTFKTSTPIKERECLEVEILLQGFGPLRLTSQVKWVMEAPEVLPLPEATTTPKEEAEAPLSVPVKPMPCYSGQLELWATEKQQQILRNFLIQQSTRDRKPINSP